jgi:hypothetical protein
MADIIRQMQTQLPAGLCMPAGCMLLCSVHPTAGDCARIFAGNDGAFHLESQEVSLIRDLKHPLAGLLPGLRMHLDCPNPETENNSGYSHIMSFSIPLADCLKSIQATGMWVQKRQTSEDGMTFQVHVTVDDTAAMDLFNKKYAHSGWKSALNTGGEAAQPLQESIDKILHHQSLMSKMGMPPQSVEQLVATAESCRQTRTAACLKVLNQISPHTERDFNMQLQWGRAFGTILDQQQCGIVREGSVMSHGSDQTALHFTLAAASLLAHVMQESDLGLLPDLAPHALNSYISAHGVSGLWHAFLQQVQMGYCYRTSYHFDSGFGPLLKMAAAQRNDDGTTTVRFAPTFGVLPGVASEDQNLCPGTNFADLNCLNLRDCEDGAMHVNAANDFLKVNTLESTLSKVSSVLEMLPADIQAVGRPLLTIAQQLHAHVNQTTPPPGHVEFKNLSAKTFAPALACAADRGSQQSRSADATLFKLTSTSLLASSPQLASASISSDANNPCAKLDCSARDHHNYWINALQSTTPKLGGHAVAIALDTLPVLSTVIDGTSVDVHLLNEQNELKVYESTAPAVQTMAVDSESVQLNLSNKPSTPMREQLRTQLAAREPLTLCMALNVRSALHVAETKALMATEQVQQANKRLQTGDAIQKTNSALPSMVPRQAFGLRAQANSQSELERQINTKFYHTLLATEQGNVYSLDLAQDSASTYAGMSIARKLPNTASVVVGAQMSASEVAALHTLGALQSCFLLTARETLASMPPLMPLALQQRMKLCAGAVVPQASKDISQKLTCGMIAQTALLPISHSSSPQAIFENMHAVASMAGQVVGPTVTFSGGPFADSVLIEFL